MWRPVSGDCPYYLPVFSVVFLFGWVGTFLETKIRLFLWAGFFDRLVVINYGTEGTWGCLFVTQCYIYVCATAHISTAVRTPLSHHPHPKENVMSIKAVGNIPTIQKEITQVFRSLGESFSKEEIITKVFRKLQDQDRSDISMLVSDFLRDQVSIGTIWGMKDNYEFRVKRT